MNKLKARKAVNAAKATKPVKAVKAVKATAARTATKETLRSRASKAGKHTHHQPHHGKHADKMNPANNTSPESEVITKTIKWSAAELKQFRERLQKLHDITVDAIGFLAGGHLANSKDGVASKSGGDSQDRAEDGTENFAQDLSLMQVSNKQDMLNKIIDAFRRLDQRTYGLCEGCGGLIAEARLQVQPFATMCIKCQAASEANRPRSPGFRKSMVQMVDSELS